MAFPSQSICVLQLHSITGRGQDSFDPYCILKCLQIQLLQLNVLNFESSSVSYSEVIGSLIFDFLIIYLKK